MKISTKHYIIKEYDFFARGKENEVLDDNARNVLSSEAFDTLESFILTNSSTGTGNTEVVELLSLSQRKGTGKIITAKNYVGLIITTDGTVIEILPKIHGIEKGIDEKEAITKTKLIFLEMLRTLKEVPFFKDFDFSNLKADRLNLFEIFIKMFVNEVTALTKQGLKSAYIPIEENERFYKGKLLVAQNIKFNLVSKERFFVRYDEFSLNRPENRLIKSTLKYLYGYTQDSDNKRNINRLLGMFEEINFSSNYDSDFSKCSDDRSVTHYQKTLSWAKIFLKKKTFTAFAGKNIAISLLFPMEKIFESYIAELFRKNLSTDWTMSTQDKSYYLFDKPKAFRLKPDIVLTDKNSSSKIVLDTKWKLLTQKEDISQSDMYQMYAYGKKYSAKKVVLLYPATETEMKIKNYCDDDGVDVEIEFLNLSEKTETENAVNKILQKFVYKEVV